MKLPPKVRALSRFRADIEVRNISGETWKDPWTLNPFHGEWKYAIRLANRWWRVGQNNPAIGYLERADLTSPVGPGGVASFAVPLVAPGEPGRYNLQFDLLQEEVAWFESRGAGVLFVPVEVVAN